jgi:hypothetical protein
VAGEQEKEAEDSTVSQSRLASRYPHAEGISHANFLGSMTVTIGIVFFDTFVSFLASVCFHHPSEEGR